MTTSWEVPRLDSAQAKRYHSELIVELRQIGSVEGGFNRKHRMSVLRQAAAYRRLYFREKQWEKSA